MVEAIGIFLALVSISFAFETPRRKIIGLFRRMPVVVQSFKVQTQFHSHNDGKRLGPLGTNRTDKNYVLVWEVQNMASELLQIERGLLLKGAASNGNNILLRPPEFTSDQTILPRHKHTLLTVELTPGVVDHYRHWVRESTAFGFKTSAGIEHLVDNDQFVAFGSVLNKIATEYGLAAEVPEGRQVVIQLKQNPEERE